MLYKFFGTIAIPGFDLPKIGKKKKNKWHWGCPLGKDWLTLGRAGGGGDCTLIEFLPPSPRCSSLCSLFSLSCSLDSLRRCRAPHPHHPPRLSPTKNLASSSTSRYQLLQRISRCYIGTISSYSCSSMSAVAASKHSSSVFVCFRLNIAVPVWSSLAILVWAASFTGT